MLKQNSPILIHAQGLHWTHQRLLGLASQLCMLIVAVIIVTSIIITLGERPLTRMSGQHKGMQSCKLLAV